jgi:hypothetical protein
MQTDVAEKIYERVKVLPLEKRIANYNFVTTDSVLSELLNYFSGYGPDVRREVAALVKDILKDQTFVVVAQSREVLLEGLSLYESVSIKGTALPTASR